MRARMKGGVTKKGGSKEQVHIEQNYDILYSHQIEAIAIALISRATGPSPSG